MDDLKEQSRAELVQFCMQWIDSEKVKKREKDKFHEFLMDDEEEVPNKTLSGKNIEYDEDVEMTDKEDESSTNSPTGSDERVNLDVNSIKNF